MTSLKLFDYQLPPELIAQYPCEQRDGSRLLVVDRATGSLADQHFADLPKYLHEGDVLVLNDSRVMHARLQGEKQKTGARIELFLLKSIATEKDGPNTWEALARPARRLKPGDVVRFGPDLAARVLHKTEDGSLIVSFDCTGSFPEVLERVGSVPLPPYIQREARTLDVERYQTVYANETGSAAAPTAGLHFTTALLDELRRMAVHTVFVTLHVGLGTFRPVQTESIEDHHMHEEIYHISEQAASTINAAKREGRRVICVGTTSVRTLESAAAPDRCGDTTAPVAPGWGSTNIFIYPGGRHFLVTDALITNFHLPRSTLLMLVAAFYNRTGTLAAYAHAIEAGYRFFSYGDAMLIL
jgi:S-adenosylmethionine:tRNA ribosyltransferase-isomerase